MDRKQESNNQHSDFRVTAPATVTIDESKYKVNNWSIEGFQISKFNQKAKVGDCLPIHFSLSFKEGINISTDTLIEIKSFSERNSKLEARFLNLTKLEKELLQQAIDNLLTGEITPIESPTKGSDIPGEIANGSSQSGSGDRKIFKQFSLKFVLYSLLYLAIGGTLGFFTLRALYGSVTQMQIKSAVLTKPIEPIISTSWGTLSQLYVEEGMKVEAGQPLLQLNDEEMARSISENEAHNVDALARNEIENIDSLTEKIELSRIELAEAKVGLQKAESLRQQEIEKLKPYQAIAQNKLASARARVEALTVQYQAEKNNRDRFSDLLQAGAVSKQTFDSVSSKFADVDADLREAKAELQIAETAVNSVQNGNFYNGDNLVGDLPRLTADVKDARDRVQLAARKVSTLEQALQKQKQDLQALQKQKQNLQVLATSKTKLTTSVQPLDKTKQQSLSSVVYRAPFSGSVLKVVKSLGNTVQRSETLMLLQPELAEPTVEAYLTQDQAAQLSMSSQVTALIPELNKSYPARVVKIDRSGGLLDEVRGQYQLQGSPDQSAYVKLVLSGVNQETTSQLMTGMPVVINIKKNLNPQERLRFLSHNRPNN
ncbi:HlyD family efflux transporter periplasmic adaptor subunit [Coleofasciculus sp. FACHB-712]|uniref:HlyD family secretion protein n=1 Tax=Coleofasciculus sp. FACHB-712 TaxID=2692789 RepID=UPI001684AB68|nr:HlyD family efflux transporter periplasmic adaptor subunit [Coleofasciculus sp. FACHB-712]MBD1945065.1 HlyD family efflux transporter periplasmic adaptor subunit [Coleofasciculus sp. FACHB-712]